MASASHLNSMALPFSSFAFADWQLYADDPMPGCFIPPVRGVAGYSLSVSESLSSCAGTFSASGVPSFPTPAWVPVQYLPLPSPVTLLCSPSSVKIVCSPPPLPPPSSRCIITEILDQESPIAEGDDKPSPRSVLQPDAAQTKVQRRAAHHPTLASPTYRDKAPFDPKSNKTSLMICNIPNNFSKRRLMAILDQHCAEENDKLLRRGHHGVVMSEYDFLYVPIDFRTMFNKGYAFVNTTTATAARRLHSYLHGHSWDAVGSKKICQVMHARLEGVDAFVKHFGGTYFPCHDTELLPVRFGPARDGSRRTAERVIGHLRHRGHLSCAPAC